MPLISVNIKDSGGLASHSNTVTASIERSLKNKSYADLIFVARNGTVHCHQAVLESLSPTLQGMFQAHNCCTCSGSSCGRREVIQVHLPDVSRETLRSVLAIIYSGKCHVSSPSQAEDVRLVMRLLDLKLPGDLRQERAGGAGPESSVLNTPSSSQSSRLEAGAKRKRSEGAASRPSPAKVARTEEPRVSPETLLIEMAKRLMPFSENKSLPCNFPGCGATLTHLDMTDHFKMHFRARTEQQAAVKPGAIRFRCQHCDKEFKFRRALDVHLKKCSAFKDNKETSPRNRLDSFSSTSSEGGTSDKDISNKTSAANVAKERILANKDLFGEDSDGSTGNRDIMTQIRNSPQKRIPTISTSSGDNTGTVEDKDNHDTISETGDDESELKNRSPIKGKIFVCKQCDEEVKSEWHLHPSRHDCKKKNENIEEDGYYCQHCKNPYISEKSLQVHETRCPILKAKGDNNESTNQKNKSSNSPESATNAKFECPKCGKIFSRRGNLKYHIGIKHFQEKLTSIYHGTKCKECDKVLESNVELLKHVSMDHEKILKYLLGKEGLLLPAKLEKVKESNKDQKQTVLSSYLVNNDAKRVTPTNTSASPVKKPQLNTNYKCPKCEQRFDDRTRMKIHVGVLHYSEKLKAVYPGTQCSICDKECQKPSWLLRHVSINHEKVLVYLLAKEGLLLPSKAQKENPAERNETEMSEVEDKHTATPTLGQVSLDSQLKDDEMNKYSCPKCGKSFQDRWMFKGHLGPVHYAEKLKAAHPGSRCSICYKEFQHQHPYMLLAHVSQKHEEVLVSLLAEEGLLLPPKAFKCKGHEIDRKILEDPEEKMEEETETLEVNDQGDTSEELYFGEQCVICEKSISGVPVFAIRHYFSKHFKEKLMKEDPEAYEKFKCFICGEVLESKKPRLSYISHFLKHSELVKKYLAQDGHMLPEKSQSYSEGEHGFRVKKIRVDVKLTQEIREKVQQLVVDEDEVFSDERSEEAKQSDSDISHDYVEDQEESGPEEPRLSNEELLKCFLCLKDFNTTGGQTALLSHYSRDHYRLELEHNYITKQGNTWSEDRKCGDCGVLISNREEYVHHLGVSHRHVLQFLPDKFRPPAPEPVKEVVSPEKEVFRCPVMDCDSEKETRKALLIHLLMIHFNKDMELEYRDTFRAMKVKKCPDCGMALLDNYLYFIKHLAVDHEQVLKYVTLDEKERGEVEKEPTNESHHTEDHTEDHTEEKDEVSRPTSDKQKGSMSSEFVKSSESDSDVDLPTSTSRKRKEFSSAEFVESSESDSDVDKRGDVLQTGVIMNESKQLNDQTPPPEEGKLNQSFDLRAILDSDSDSE